MLNPGLIALGAATCSLVVAVPSVLATPISAPFTPAAVAVAAVSASSPHASPGRSGAEATPAGRGRQVAVAVLPPPPAATRRIPATGAERTRSVLPGRAPGQRSDARTGAAEMPWIWREVRRVARTHLPRRKIRRFDTALAPVIVAGPADTVPGVGIEGVF